MTPNAQTKSGLFMVNYFHISSYKLLDAEHRLFLFYFSNKRIEEIGDQNLSKS